MHLKLTRDEDGRPVDALHIHGYAPREESQVLEKAIWASLSEDADLPGRLGVLDDATGAASRWPSPSFCCCTTCWRRPVDFPPKGTYTGRNST